MNDLITNGTEIKQRIISEIKNAKQSIFIAMAYFTDKAIASALIEAKERKLTVEVILSSNAQNETVKSMLKEVNILVHAFDTGDSRGIMHHKFCLIDDNISINGSYNYSINASNNNVENIQVSDDKTTHSQFLSEFERLKYNIDNNIAVHKVITDLSDKKEKNEPKNIVTKFSEQLQNLIYSSTQIDTEKYRSQGYNLSKESKGSLDIFSTEYDNIKEEIRAYATEDGLGSTKSTLSTNISNAYLSLKASLNEEKKEKISIEKRKNDIERNQVNSKYNNLVERKSILESGDNTTGEKGIYQINKEIEKNKIEKKSLEQSITVRKFWNPETILILFGLIIFILYLSLFFASAMYKVFFESNAIKASLEAGLRPELPQIVDANAIIKIFSLHGPLFGFIASIFFLVPILLSNLKILGSNKKKLNLLMFGIGIIIFDLIVSIMVTKNIYEIRGLLIGRESSTQIHEIFMHGEFWITFVFGMLPLIITHFLIEKLSITYKKSRIEFVSAEINNQLKNLDAYMIDLLSEKNSLIYKRDKIDVLIQDCRGKINDLEILLNNLITKIENYYSELFKKVKVMYHDFNTKVISGKIFTNVLLNTIISSFKSGFIEYLPQYYAVDEVSRRVKGIEQVIITLNK